MGVYRFESYQGHKYRSAIVYITTATPKLIAHSIFRVFSNLLQINAIVATHNIIVITSGFSNTNRNFGFSFIPIMIMIIITVHTLNILTIPFTNVSADIGKRLVVFITIKVCLFKL